MASVGSSSRSNLKCYDSVPFNLPEELESTLNEDTFVDFIQYFREVMSEGKTDPRSLILTLQAPLATEVTQTEEQKQKRFVTFFFFL
jgi:hypothetical protein